MVAVVGQEAEITDALYARALLMKTTGPTLPVSVPNPVAAFVKPQGPYLEARVLLNRPRYEGLSAGRLPQGMLMINVVEPKGRGEIEPAVIGRKVLDHFAKGSRLTVGATTVVVDKEPWMAAGIAGDVETRYPITVYWVVSR